MTMWWTKPCAVCALKDAVIDRLRDDLARERLRLDRAEAKASTATDALLAKAGQPTLTPPQKWTQADAENLMKESFAFFKDEHDTGDGKVRDIDQLDYDQK